MNRGNGGIFGKKNLPSSSSAGGAWGFIDQQRSKVGNIWPSRPDNNFAYTPLLLKTAAQSIRSTTVVDSSPNNLTLTRNGTVSTGLTGPYQTDGYWGNYFNGSSDYLSAPSSTAFSFGSGVDFTVECWVYLTAYSSGGTAGGALVGTVGGAYTGWAINSGQDINTLRITSNVTGGWADNITVTAGNGLPLNQWTHIAFVRSGAVLTLYKNGVSVGSLSGASAYNFTSPNNLVYIARFQDATLTRYVPGYISNVRIVKGTAVYTEAFTPSTTPLTAIANTSILTCQSNRFRDNSTNNFDLTVSGAPRVTPDWYPSTFTTPAASLGAGLFNGGSADYIVNSSTSVGAFGSNNFTVEAWVYPTIALSGTLNTIISTLPSSTNSGWHLYYLNTGFGIRSNLVNYTQSSTVLTPYAWSHIAWCRNGTTYYLYLNGKQLATSSTMASWTDTYLAMGQTPFGSNNILTGYIANVRLVNGLAVYAASTNGTQVFTPPSNFLTQTGGTYPSAANITNPSAAQTTLLVNFQDSNFTSATNAVQNNTFIDSSAYAAPITRSGTATQGSFTPYWPRGYWSNYFNGSTDSIYTSTTFALPTATTPFTMEAWVNFSSFSGVAIAASAYAGSGPIPFVMGMASSSVFTSATATPMFAYYNGSAWIVVVQSSTSLSLNTWYHLAYVYTGSSATIYANGTSIGTATVSTWQTTSQAGFYVGRRWDTASPAYFNGYISNFRLTIGTAVYTAEFTPSAIPLTAIPNTSLLPCQSNRFQDNSANAYAITVNGTPQVQAFHPFSTAAVYTPSVYGGSGYFNGSTDYLNVATNTAFGFGTGDFTVEFWTYPTSTSRQDWIDITTPGSTRVLIYYDGANIVFYGQPPQNALITGPAITVNRWYHIALSKQSTSTKLFVNGVQVGSTYADTNNYGSTNQVFIGKDGGGSTYISGYISNLRVVKGTAVYTANFTPPTAPVTAITNTSLLLNFTNAAIYDAAARNYAITQSTAQLNNSIYKWAPASMRFNGSTDYLTMPLINFGSGATATSFTAEGWFYTTTATADQTVVSQYTSSTNGWAVRIIGASSKLGVTLNGDTFNITGTTTILANTWYYFAFSGSVGSWKLFLGTSGTTSQEGSTFTGSVNLGDNSSLFLQVGRTSNVVYFNGYIQDIRITRAVVRYTSPPLVPTETFGISGSNYPKIEYLVVAGGGGGGYSVGGGGGAGGLISGNDLDVGPGSSYTVTIGGGGIAGTVGSTPGGNGSPSIFGLFTAIGGGAGAGSGVTAIATGRSGGSGGGGAMVDGGGTVQGGSGTTGQGNNGGTGVHVPGNYAYSGGGGGAGAVGTAGGPGGGGIGIQTSITGTATYYAGGGGGGGSGNGAGGSGGGGSPGVDGTTNTGGGGGGSNISTNGRTGGSGIVIIAYPNIFPDISFIDSGLSYTQPTRFGYKVYRFTAGTGTIRW
jgi:hypothetical protein